MHKQTNASPDAPRDKQKKTRQTWFLLFLSSLSGLSATHPTSSISAKTTPPPPVSTALAQRFSETTTCSERLMGPTHPPPANHGRTTLVGCTALFAANTRRLKLISQFDVNGRQPMPSCEAVCGPSQLKTHTSARSSTQHARTHSPGCSVSRFQNSSARR